MPEQYPRHGQGRPQGAPARGPRQGAPPAPSIEVLFDPARRDVDLFDSLAEQQAEGLPEINASQLRRFFGDVKDLARRFDSLSRGKSPDEAEAIYRVQIEPLFKLLRSKVNYASRAGAQGKLPPQYANMIETGVARVGTGVDFRRFVTHFEAVVGFLYGKGRVKS